MSRLGNKIKVGLIATMTAFSVFVAGPFAYAAQCPVPGGDGRVATQDERRQLEALLDSLSKNDTKVKSPADVLRESSVPELQKRASRAVADLTEEVNYRTLASTTDPNPHLPEGLGLSPTGGKHLSQFGDIKVPGLGSLAKTVNKLTHWGKSGVRELAYNFLDFQTFSEIKDAFSADMSALDRSATFIGLISNELGALLWLGSAIESGDAVRIAAASLFATQAFLGLVESFTLGAIGASIVGWVAAFIGTALLVWTGMTERTDRFHATSPLTWSTAKIQTNVDKAFARWAPRALAEGMPGLFQNAAHLFETAQRTVVWDALVAQSFIDREAAMYERPAAEAADAKSQIRAAAAGAQARLRTAWISAVVDQGITHVSEGVGYDQFKQTTLQNMIWPSYRAEVNENCSLGHNLYDKRSRVSFTTETDENWFCHPDRCQVPANAAKSLATDARLAANSIGSAELRAAGESLKRGYGEGTYRMPVQPVTSTGTPTPTGSATPTPTPTPKLTGSPTPTPTGSPTPKPFVVPKVEGLVKGSLCNDVFPSGSSEPEKPIDLAEFSSKTGDLVFPVMNVPDSLAPESAVVLPWEITTPASSRLQQEALWSSVAADDDVKEGPDTPKAQVPQDGAERAEAPRTATGTAPSAATTALPEAAAPKADASSVAAVKAEAPKDAAKEAGASEATSGRASPVVSAAAVNWNQKIRGQGVGGTAIQVRSLGDGADQVLCPKITVTVYGYWTCTPQKPIQPGVEATIVAERIDAAAPSQTVTHTPVSSDRSHVATPSARPSRVSTPSVRPSLPATSSALPSSASGESDDEQDDSDGWDDAEWSDEEWNSNELARLVVKIAGTRLATSAVSVHRDTGTQVYSGKATAGSDLTLGVVCGDTTTLLTPKARVNPDSTWSRVVRHLEQNLIRASCTLRVTDVTHDVSVSGAADVLAPVSGTYRFAALNAKNSVWAGAAPGQTAIAVTQDLLNAAPATVRVMTATGVVLKETTVVTKRPVGWWLNVASGTSIHIEVTSAGRDAYRSADWIVPAPRQSIGVQQSDRGSSPAPTR